MTDDGKNTVMQVERFPDDFAYGNVSTEEFIATAKEVSGLAGAELALLDEYFQQWLYGTERPTILPEDF